MNNQETTISLMEIINIIAIVVAPIIAVWVGQLLQTKSERRKDKLQIFKTLMTARIYGWTVDSVHALNIIDVVFADDKAVRAAWADLNDKYHVSAPDQQHLEKVKRAQDKLLETMAKSLGYKDKITWETIQNPYIPDTMARQIEAQRNQQQQYSELLSKANEMFGPMPWGQSPERQSNRKETRKDL